MASLKDKGTLSGEPKAYHVQGPVREAAKWLRTSSRRFLEERDPATSVDEAVAEWLRVRNAKPGETLDAIRLQAIMGTRHLDSIEELAAYIELTEGDLARLQDLTHQETER